MQQLLHNRYEVRDRLSNKPGRQTLLAYDHQTEALVVVKVLTFSTETLSTNITWEHVRLFEREAIVLKDLEHPSIPKYLDFFDLDLADGQGYGLTQTYIPAQSLQAHLEAGRTFNEVDVKELALKLLEILSYLHDRQPAVIHRDIKPSNILLTNRSGNSVGQLYLVDFGSVQTLVTPEGETITIVGTYGYMPPEQFGYHSQPASDLYALGASLIHLATGLSPAKLLQENLRLEFKTQTRLSTHLNDWLTVMTEPALENRFASVKEALEALQNEARVGKGHVLKIKPLNGSSVLKVRSQLKIVENSRDQLFIVADMYERLANPALQPDFKAREQVSQKNAWLKGFGSILAIIWFVQALGTPTGIGLLVISIVILSLLRGFVKLWSFFHPPNAIKQRDSYIRFETKHNFFQVSNPQGRYSGKISDIRYVTLSQAGCWNHVMDPHPLAKVVIRTDKLYKIPWKLTEEECMWLVQQIQDWLLMIKDNNH